MAPCVKGSARSARQSTAPSVRGMPSFATFWGILPLYYRSGDICVFVHVRICLFFVAWCGIYYVIFDHCLLIMQSDA